MLELGIIKKGVFCLYIHMSSVNEDIYAHAVNRLMNHSSNRPVLFDVYGTVLSVNLVLNGGNDPIKQLYYIEGDGGAIDVF